MNQQRCDEVSRKLVEFCDGELDSAARARIAEHLVECPACRVAAQRLRRSLEIVQEIWADANRRAALEDPAPRAQPAVRQSPPRRLRWIAAASAAAAMLLALVATFRSPPADQHPAAVAPQAVQTVQAVQAEPTLSSEEIETLVAHADRSARLAAAARMLAEEPSLEPYRQRTIEYLKERYNVSVSE